MHKRLLLFVSVLLMISGITSCLAVPTGIPASATPLSSSNSTSLPTSTKPPELVGTKSPTITPSGTPEPTFTPIPTFTETPTPTEVPFSPEVEGFKEGPLGLMRNPENGQDTLAFNPEFDYVRLKEGIIEGFWDANMSYFKDGFTTHRSYAMGFKTAKAFADAVESDNKLVDIGLPVRDNVFDYNNINRQKVDATYYNVTKLGRTVYMRLEYEKVNLSLPIEWQILDPQNFVNFSGPWDDPNQKAFSETYIHGSFDKGNGAVLFSVGPSGELIITTGSFDNSNMPIANDNPDLTFGKYDPSLANSKYSFLYDKYGYGKKVDEAASFYAGGVTLMLHNFTTFAGTVNGNITVNHLPMKTIGGIDWGGPLGDLESYWFVKQKLFIFTN